jgi:hypothetical protein
MFGGASWWRLSCRCCCGGERRNVKVWGGHRLEEPFAGDNTSNILSFSIETFQWVNKTDKSFPPLCGRNGGKLRM